jgi:hypothetical protein
MVAGIGSAAKRGRFAVTDTSVLAGRGCWLDRMLKGSAVAAIIAIAASPASADDMLVVEVATFEAGRFVISGTAPSGAEVRIAGTEIAAQADPVTGAFRIARRTVLPGCRIDVEAGSTTASVAVANCREAMLGIETPQPTTLLRPRGGWTSTRSYRVNDVVEFDGQHWRSILNGKGRQPGLASTVAFWTVLDPGADAPDMDMDDEEIEMPTGFDVSPLD